MHSGFQTSASPPRERSARGEKYVQSRELERATEGGWKRREAWDGRGVDTLLGISTYDCPGGVHRSAKQSSPGLDPSRALRALFSAPPPERGNVSRYTREHRGVGYLSTVRCCCLVSGSIYSTRTHDLRNSRGSPMCGSVFPLPLSSSLSLVWVYVCLPRSRSPTIFFSYGGKRISRRRGFTARGIRTTPVRLGALLPVTRWILSFSLSLLLALRGVSSMPIFFFEQTTSATKEGGRERGSRLTGSDREDARVWGKGGTPIILRFRASH